MAAILGTIFVILGVLCLFQIVDDDTSDDDGDDLSEEK